MQRRKAHSSKHSRSNTAKFSSCAACSYTDSDRKRMSPLFSCLIVMAATVLASSQSSHLSPVFPEEICLLRSHVDMGHFFPAEAARPLTSELYLSIVTEWDKIIQQTYDNAHMTEADSLQRRTILSDLLTGLSERNVTLEVIGSCCNGFGTAASDLDVQLTGNINRSEIVQLSAKEFSMYYISKPKPLLVLRHSHTGLHVDVTVNPTDGDNMGVFMWVLRKYSRFDPRAQVLGVFLKTVVKKLKISETIFGDLGSSLYITLLIHYLQQTNPPVLPGIPKNKTNASKLVVRNNATVGQLWLGFLRYYVHEFNYEEDIICLYHVTCKTRKEKGWYGPDHNMISIEGPTAEEIDEVKRLPPLMSDYILKVFNQLQTFYLKDNYAGLLRRNDINLDYHNRYGHKRDLLVDTWGCHNRTSCEAVEPEWIQHLN